MWGNPEYPQLFPLATPTPDTKHVSTQPFPHDFNVELPPNHYATPILP